MSCWAQAMVAATKAVAAPIDATTIRASADSASSGLIRHIR